MRPVDERHAVKKKKFFHQYILFFKVMKRS
jgi:hypothetical protein